MGAWRAGGSRIDIGVRGGTLDGAAAILVEIEDEGAGPPLSPGRRADGVPGQRGAGLGLIVAAGIVAHHGGRFQILSRDGVRGANARLLLPAIVAARFVTAPLDGAGVGSC